MNQPEFINSVFSEAGIPVSSRSAEQLIRYYELLTERNSVMNLTAITDFKEVAVKHFVDSGMLFSEKLAAALPDLKLSSGGGLIDVGTGAGFPGLPIKILCPEARVLLLDALDKRVRFLNDVICELGLTGVDTVHARAEEGVFLKRDGAPFRESFHVAVSRAVADLSVLSEYCLPYVEVGGLFIAYKSANVEEEVKKSSNALGVLGGEVENVFKFELPENGGARSLVVIRKMAATPEKYPRKAGKPVKKPL